MTESRQSQRSGDASTLIQARGNVHFGMTVTQAQQYIDSALTGRIREPGRKPNPIPGWIQITTEYLEKIVSREDLSTYFDGASPDWKDICHPGLRPRPAVAELLRTFQGAQLDDRSIVQLVLGASGEGKSTALMQACRQLAFDETFDAIYWRRSSGARLSIETVAEFVACFRNTLIVADDAESLLEDLDLLSQLPFAEDEIYLHFLLASRDTDWIAERDRLGWVTTVDSRWSKNVRFASRVKLEGVKIADARVISANWSACSPRLPTPVADFSPEEVAQRLFAASKASETRQALLGGLIEVRLGAEGLEHRVATLLETSSRATPGSADYTLADFLLVLAGIDVARLPGIPRDVAAAFFAIEESDLRAAVETPLKREFAFGTSSRNLFARHPVVARAILKEALGEDSQVRAGRAYEHLLVSVRDVRQQLGFWRPGLGRLIDMGRRLMQSELSTDLIGDLALGTTRCARELFPDSLSNHVAVSQTLRDLGEPKRALEEVWRNVMPVMDHPENWNDSRIHLRGAWRDLSATLGTAGVRASSYWAAAVSLSDRLAVPIGADDIVQGLNQLALNARNEIVDFGVSQDLVMVVAQVQALTGQSGTPLFNEARYGDRYLRDIGIPPRSFGGSDDLQVAIVKAATAFQNTESDRDDWPDRFGVDRDTSFDSFVQAVARYTKGVGANA